MEKTANIIDQSNFLNIEDFDLNENETGISAKMNSPRTLEAMRILGL